MKRRDFLINSAGTAGLLLLSSCSTFKGSSNNSLIKNHSKFLLGEGDPDNKKANALLITSTNGEHNLIEAPCKAHGIMVAPNNPDLAFASSKWAEYAYLADIKNNKLVKVVVADKKHSFYGHSLYSADGKFIFASMMDLENDEGYISVRDSTTLKEIKRIQSYGRQPHQLHWIEQDKIVGVINSTPLNSDKEYYHSIFSVINVQNGQLIKSHRTSIRKHSHFSFTKDLNTAIICRAATHGDMTLFETLNLSNGNLVIAKEDSPVAGAKTESLSHYLVEEKNLAVITIVGSNKVVGWDYVKNTVVFAKEFTDKPQGIVTDRSGEHTFVSFYNSNRSYIHMYKTANVLKNNFTPMMTMAGASGSHLTLI